MSPSTADRLKKLLIVPVGLLGVAIFLFQVKGRNQPRQEKPEEEIRTVRVVRVPSLAVTPRVIGYGNVRPAKVWKAIAEVSGKIIQVHPRLQKGAILPAGTVLLKIDPTDYQLAVAQIKAGIRSTRAEMAELDTREENARVSLGIEERALALNRKELDRKRELVRKSTIMTQSAVDEEERIFLRQQQTVQALRNTLNLVPAEREVLEAKLALQRAQLEEAERNLQRTTLVLPLDARIAEFDAERTQFARQGQELVVADGINVSEVSAQIPIDKLRRLAEGRVNRPVTLEDAGRIGELLGLTAVVRLRDGDFTAEWPARFDRVGETVDRQTRTVGAIVAVEDAFRKVRPGVRPLLTKDMFVEVEIRGGPLPGRLVLPRAALHGDRVYLAAPDDRLEIRRVEVEWVQTNFAVVRSGVREGERIVISDLAPAVAGMRLKAVPDDDALRSLDQEARGAVPVK